MSSFAVRQALASGEWREIKDPSSGKSYFFHKQSNRTVWDLEKELGGTSMASPSTLSQASRKQQPATPAVESGSSTIALPRSVPAPEDYAAMAVEMVERGVWQRISQEHRGGAFYQHTESGETTRDLALYLEIRAAVGGAEPTDPEHQSANPLVAPESMGELRGIHGELLNPNDLLDVDTWITLFLARQHGGDYDVAARRLLNQVLRRTGQWETMRQADARLLELERQKDEWTATCAAQSALIAQQATELEALRAIVFYGVEGLQVAASRQRDRSNGGGVGTLPHLPADAVASLRRLVGGGDGRPQPGAGHQHAAGDQVVGTSPTRVVAPHRSQHTATEGADRLSILEGLVATLQHKNRTLEAELYEARSEQHRAVVCPSCSEADPWRRLLQSAVGTSASRSADSAPAVTEHLRPTLTGAAMLPRHLVSPTTKGRPSRNEGELLPQARDRHEHAAVAIGRGHVAPQMPLSHMLQPARR